MVYKTMVDISIHALLAESDDMDNSFGGNNHYISIHALLAESDSCTAETDITLIGFLSTLSLRRATNINSSVNTADKISIHALLAESDKNSPALLSNNQNISIHALLAESDGLSYDG